MFKKSVLAAALIILGSSSAAFAESDNFLTEAIQINLAEIAVGNLAQKNGGTDDVRGFGKMLAEDHTASNQKAIALAEAKGITPPSEPKPQDKKTGEDLANLSGEQFDRQFAEAMVKGHKAAIGKFEAASKGDDDVAKYAEETLPTLQKHLDQAQLLATKKTTSENVQPNAVPAQLNVAERNEAVPDSEQKTARSTEMIGTLSDQGRPISEYYNQSVYDTNDNKIGEVNDLLVDKSGKISAVIVGVGGFLGMGEKNVAVPFSSLKLTEKNSNHYLVFETSKEALQTAPGYTYDRSNRVWMPASKQG
jgi:putative membrane protein